MHDVIDLSPLMQPLDIGKIVLPNRFVLPSMQRGWTERGIPLPVYIDYFFRRAAGGAGLINTEACAVDHTSATGRDDAVVICPQTMDIWARCVEKVHRAGSKMFLQIVHEGAARDESVGGPCPAAPTISPSGLRGPGIVYGRTCSPADMEQIRDAFVRAAIQARNTGFDGVEIHAAHGFLLDQFLWGATNTRDDDYGGALIANRVRFPAEVVAAVRDGVGPDFPISFRFSNWKSTSFDAQIVDTPDDLRTMITILRSAGVDVFNASVRRFWAPQWAGSDWGLAGWTKSMTDAAVITVGSVGISVDVLDNLAGVAEARSSGQDRLGDLLARFGRGEFDLVAVGRSLLGDPDWIRKVASADYEAISVFSRAVLLDTIGGELPDAYAKAAAASRMP